jgi:hypothetical protein
MKTVQELGQICLLISGMKFHKEYKEEKTDLKIKIQPFGFVSSAFLMHGHAMQLHWGPTSIGTPCLSMFVVYGMLFNV